MRSRQTKADAIQRGLGNPRGTSKSPKYLRKLATDTTADDTDADVEWDARQLAADTTADDADGDADGGARQLAADTTLLMMLMLIQMLTGMLKTSMQTMGNPLHPMLMRLICKQIW